MTALLLDFDGTLVDTRRDLAQGVNLLLTELGLPTLPVETVVTFIGRGARSLIRRSMEHVDPEERVARDEQTLRRFLGHYETVMLDTSRPFPGVVEGLMELQGAGVPMAIVSNKPEAPTRAITSSLGLDRFFEVILGGDSTPHKKPHPLPLERAAHALGQPLAECIMVGDSDIDLAAARAAGIPGIWCTWGGIHPDRPSEADRVADNFDEVVRAVLQG